MLGKPDLSLWVTRYQIAAEQQKIWREDCATWESFYEQTWVIDGLPENVKATIPSTARAIVDEATDHSDFNPDWLKINLPTYGMSTDAELNSSLLRSFIIGWLTYQAEHANDVSPYRDWTKNVYLLGKGVYKVVADYASWPELNIADGTTEAEARALQAQVTAEREFAGIPAVLRSIYPLALYEDPSIGEKRWAIEVYEGAASEIAPLYEAWQPQTRKDDGSTYTRDELEEMNARLQIWDCYQLGEMAGLKGIWHQVCLNELPLSLAAGTGEATAAFGINLSPASGPESTAVFMPNEPFPYVVKFSGLGRQSSGRYEEKARGILSGVISLLAAEARRLTQLDSIISQMAWPTFFVTGNRSRFEIAFGPNMVNYVPPGTTAVPMVPPIPAGPIQSALATIQSGIERGTFGSVIRGDKPANTTSAAQLAILSGQARLRFGAIHMQHASALAEVAGKVTHIVKHVIKEPVTIWQTDDVDETSAEKVVVKPSNIPNHLVVRFDIATDPAEQRDREIQLAAFMFEKGAIDLEEFRERCGIRNTAAMRRRAIRDKVLMGSPGVIAALGEQYLLESGYDIESLTLEKASRDMLILRRQQEMYQSMMGGTGGENAAGSQPAGMNIQPSPLGGAPGMGGAPNPVPTEGSVSSAMFGPVTPGQGGQGGAQLSSRT
jgi:hypothetical protein